MSDSAGDTTGNHDDSTKYDAFISYSHAADGLLAPRLQAGLQKFAKPWWKRRAIRVFRDESSLSANPHLWSSITDALDDAEWFVLLLSPEAAQSEWVNNEVAYWTEHKGTDHILPVVTDGDYGPNVFPPALSFDVEPRWVDLRFAKTDSHLDLKNPTFAAAIADIASAVRGIPKDDLASEEVRQHRRTARTAWAAGVALAALAVAALGFGIQSADNARLAQDNAETAQRNADAETVARGEAETQRGLAEANAAEAEANAAAEAAARIEAESNARVARARELGASAVEALDTDPELATLLALEAFHVSGDEQPPVVVNAIWRAVQSDHLEYVLPAAGRFAELDLSPDDSRLVVTSQAAVRMFRAPEGDLLWTYDELDSPDRFTNPIFSPDGSRVAISVVDSSSDWFPGAVDLPPDDRPNRIVILDSTSGQVLNRVDYPSCSSAQAQAWSPDGSVLAVMSGWEPCPRDETMGVWLELLATDTLESIAVLDTANPDVPSPEVGHHVTFTPGGDLLLTHWSEGATVRSSETLEVIRVVDQFDEWGSLSPDGQLFVDFAGNRPTLLMLWDFESGERLDTLPLPAFVDFAADWASFAENGNRLAVQTIGRDTIIFDLVTGTEFLSLPSGPGSDPALNADGSWLYTSHTDGTVKAWDLEPKTVGQTVVDLLGTNDHVQAGPEFSIGPLAGSAVAVNMDTFRGRTVFFSRETGELIGEFPDAWYTLALSDGRFVGRTQFGEIRVYDLETTQSSLIAGCYSSSDDFPYLCDDTGEPQPPLFFAVSVDKTELMILNQATSEWSIVSADDGSVEEIGFELNMGPFITFTDEWILGMASRDLLQAVDRQTGAVIAEFRGQVMRSAVNHDGTQFVVVDAGQQTITVIDLATWTSWTIEANVEGPRGIAFSPSNRLLAIGDQEDILIVDMVERRQILSLPIAGASSFYWFDEETMLLGTWFPARWVTVSINAAELDDDARRGVTRSFTEAECALYRIDPCPTLDEIRSR